MDTDDHKIGGQDEHDERRQAVRRRSLKAGTILYGNFSLSHSCVVRDLSATGARLRLSGSPGIPDEFHLLLPGDHLIARVHVSWRRGDEVGVLFTEPLQGTRGHPDPRVARLALY